MSFREQFEIPAKYKMWSMILMGVGLVSILAGYFMYGTGDEHHEARFWGTLLYNSVFFLLVVNASMFFICATTMAMGGWQMAFRRVSEAISFAVIPIGIISGVILLALVFGHQHHIYHWLTPGDDKILLGKAGFLNPTFFIVWTSLSIILWIALGAKMRSISKELDSSGPLSVEEGKKYIFKNTIWASLFLVWFGLTVMSTVPWLWLMSIDAHWYSTMYSWYTFASTFVAGIALITLFVIYLKNQGYLELVNDEHLHDLGKFMFAFSIFWTYLWFSQYMLIWYANIPEETVYFKHRVQGPYRGIFFLNLIVNFLAPLLILMRRSSKRNYTLLVFMSVLIICGHWLDFYQMVIASISKDHVEFNFFDFGVAAGFVGLIMWSTGIALGKRSLLAKNHPFFKESIIHHT
ncbi:quinol:cytochrome C oxidoreductase [Flavihumibacter profundi]|uniref:quinol:cytochrome C oxidoreductase n=1 Tax=Flavihumibacter profundi TaxID=2716883 RepID=UPI001CC80224|nr:quinol:cytochrome C oxidoreductase [Flavihumibacter profundi]MBZ5858974.1 quinol:cytochrome C oxidoreductase [Flavihumibacter profundi]